jgi:hypothetical protein
MEGSINSPPPPATRRPISAQDWDVQRMTIERLYSTECRELREVMEIMERDYGFLATSVFPLVLKKHKLTSTQTASIQKKNITMASRKKSQGSRDEGHHSEAGKTQN